MSIRMITQFLSSIPLLRHRDTVNPNIQADKDDFVVKYEATNDHLASTTVAEINTMAEQINNTAEDINLVADEVEANAAIAQSIGNYQGAWNNTTAYLKNQSVSIGNLFYTAKANNTNISPSNTDYWLSNPINNKINTNISIYDEKTTPINTDLIPLCDSADAFAIKKLSWANLKATLSDLFVSKISTPTTNSLVKVNADGSISNSGVIVDDNDNVGIGTNSPVFKLDVAGGTGNGIRYTNGTIGSILGISSASGQIGTTTSHNLELLVGSTPRAIIDTSGNVGIGTTPSAWDGTKQSITLKGPGSAIHGGISSSGGDGNYTTIFNNCYYNNGWKYVYPAAYPAAKYENGSGMHRWYTAPSGTAGNPITWTTAMTLGANGNLLVGTTTDNGVDKLQVNGSIQASNVIEGNFSDSYQDLNTLNIHTRKYFVGITSSNIPIQTYGYLEVIVRDTGTYCMQRFTTYSDGRVFVRTLAGTWSAWVEK